MPMTYPPPAPTVSGDITSIHTFLQTPSLVLRRLRSLAEQRFIADALLKARFDAEGGGLQYQQSESMYTDRPPQAIRPGMEYPKSGLGVGPTQLAEVVKWGQDVPITDEAIKRLRLDPVERALTKSVNHMVSTVDSVALAVIASAITQTTPAAAAWSTATAKQILLDAALAKQKVIDLKQGYMPDTVALPGIAWAYAMAAFVEAGYVPRESPSLNPAVTGEFPVVDGMVWLTSPNTPAPATSAWVLDSTQLGGMADEDLGGPGYTGNVAGVETKVIRVEQNDGYLVRCRRVTVPVVIEPNAGWEITGVLS
jgi:hypothetical protein